MRFRKKAREHSLIVLYRWDIRGDSLEKILKEVVEEKKIRKKEVLEYMETLIGTVKKHLTEIDALISESLEEWGFDRLGYIERNVLRLGVAELVFTTPPDPGRAFNDYIDLVRKYADKKAARFVNGILSRIYRKKKATSSSQKSG